MSDFELFQATYPLAIPVIAFVFGACVGSFLNVVAYRLPIMMNQEWQGQAVEVIEDATGDATFSEEIRRRLPERRESFGLVLPNSRCPHCDAAIKPWHNIPILGYFIIRGRCASCSTPISARYPTIEALTAVLTMTTVWVLGASLLGLAGCVLTWALIALALIDFDTQLLPDSITLPFLWLGLVVNYFTVVTPFSTAFIGACAGYLVLWTVFQLFKLVTGKEGMGYGDFKMLAMLGAWLGIQMVPLIIVLSSFAGAIIGGALILFGRDREKPIKFGPFLAIAGWIALLWGPSLVEAYLELTISV